MVYVYKIVIHSIKIVIYSSNIFYEMGRLFRRRGMSYYFKNSQLNPGSTVPRLTLQVFTPKLATYERTPRQVKHAYIQMFLSVFGWVPLVIRSLVNSFQLYWYWATYICFSWDVLQINTPNFFRFSRRRFFRVFAEFFMSVASALNSWLKVLVYYI